MRHLNHFDQIDKNKDGKVTNQEIQSYGVESDLEKQKPLRTEDDVIEIGEKVY